MGLPSEEIKEKLDILDVVRGYIEVQPAGRNFRARCPFHNERTPSFMISVDRQIWHCFGCGAGGDMFKFVMLYENVEFSDALRILAEKAGVDLKRTDRVHHEQFGVLYEVNRAAADFFKETFARSARAKEYTASRGLTPEILETFEIGYAPKEYDELVTHLTRKGYKIDDIVRAGFAFRSERGTYLDRFRGRVMFPIHNHFGKVVGFSGRILPEFDNGEMGKYVNSPETAIFNKSKLLYGYWQTKEAIRTSREVVLVEGQMDFLMIYKDGVRNAVASSGTALTADHLQTLKRLAERVVFFFDNDNAGRAAAERGIDMAGEADLTPKVASLGAYKDPADAVEAEPGYVARAVKDAVPAMQYFFDRFLGGEVTGIDAKKDIRKVLEKISHTVSMIERAQWIKEASFRTGIPEKELFAEMETLEQKPAYAEKRPEAAHLEKKIDLRGRGEKISWRLLEIGYHRGDIFPEIAERSAYMPLLHQRALSLMNASAAAAGTDETVKELLDALALQRGDTFYHEGEGEDPVIHEARCLLRELELEHLKKSAQEMRARIARAEASDDESGMEELLRSFDDILRKMQDIKNGEKS